MAFSNQSNMYNSFGDLKSAANTSIAPLIRNQFDSNQSNYTSWMQSITPKQVGKIATPDIGAGTGTPIFYLPDEKGGIKYYTQNTGADSGSNPYVEYVDPAEKAAEDAKVSADAKTVEEKAAADKVEAEKVVVPTFTDTQKQELYQRVNADKSFDWSTLPSNAENPDLPSNPFIANGVDASGNPIIPTYKNYSDDQYSYFNDYYAKKDADPTSDTYLVNQANNVRQAEAKQTRQTLVTDALSHGYTGNIEATSDESLKAFNDQFLLNANNPALQKAFDDTYQKTSGYYKQGVNLDDSSSNAIDDLLRKFHAGKGTQEDLDKLNSYLPQYEISATKKAQQEAEAKAAADLAARKADNNTQVGGLLGAALANVKNGATDPAITGGYDTGQNTNLTAQIDTSALNGKGSSTVDVNGIPQVNYGNAVAGLISKDSVSQVSTDPNQLAQNRLTGMLFQGGKYLQDARNRGMRVANSRGLLNSSIAAGLAEEAAIAAAAPIAQVDAQTYAENARQNALEVNKTLETNAQLGTQTAWQNADGSLKAGMFNAGNDLSARQFNATQQQDFDKFGVKLQVDAKTQEAAWDVSGMQAKYASAIQAGRDKYSAVTDMTKLFSAQNFELNKASAQTMFDMLRDDNSAEAQKARDAILDKYAKENQSLADKGAMDRTVFTGNLNFDTALLDNKLKGLNLASDVVKSIMHDYNVSVDAIATMGDLPANVRSQAIADKGQNLVEQVTFMDGLFQEFGVNGVGSLVMDTSNMSLGNNTLTVQQPQPTPQGMIPAAQAGSLPVTPTVKSSEVPTGTGMLSLAGKTPNQVVTLFETSTPEQQSALLTSPIVLAALQKAGYVKSA